MSEYERALKAMSEDIYLGRDHEEYAKAYWLDDHWDTVIAALQSQAEKDRVMAAQDDALAKAEEWLEGWASAEPYLSVIKSARKEYAKIEGE